MLCFCPSTENTNSKREFIKIKHNGFHFHNKLHRTFDILITYFKSNFSTKQYRKEMHVFRNYSPRSKIKTGVELEEQQSVPNAAEEWQDDRIPDETPFPEKTMYIAASNGEESGWGGNSTYNNNNNVAQFSTFDKNDEWGDSNNDRSFTKTEDRNDEWNASNSYSQNSNYGGFRGCGRGGFNGRGGFRGRGRGRSDRQGGGDRACFKCGETGHFARECPNEDNDNGGGFSRGNYNRRARGRGRFGDDRGFRGRRREFDNREDDGNDQWGRRDDDMDETSSNKQGSKWGNDDADNNGNESGWAGNNASSHRDDRRKSHAFGAKDEGNGSNWGNEADDGPKDDNVGDESGWN